MHLTKHFNCFSTHLIVWQTKLDEWERQTQLLLARSRFLSRPTTVCSTSDNELPKKKSTYLDWSVSSMKSLRFDLFVCLFIAFVGLTKLASGKRAGFELSVTNIWFNTTRSSTFQGGVYQKLLLRKLFENYNPFERPAEFENQTLDVKLGMALQQIVDVVSSRTSFSSAWMLSLATKHS